MALIPPSLQCYECGAVFDGWQCETDLLLHKVQHNVEGIDLQQRELFNECE